MATGQNPQYRGSPGREGQQPSPSGSEHQPFPHGEDRSQSNPLHQINPGFVEEEGSWDNNIDNNANTALRQRKPSLFRQSSANDANELLSMMPSRHFERSKSRKNASADDDMHRSAPRRRLQRQNTRYNTIRGKPTDDALDGIVQDIGTDPKLAASELYRDDHIRSMPTTLTTKKTIKRKVSTFDRSQLPPQRKPGIFKLMKYNMLLGLRNFRLGVHNALYTFDLWHGHLHLIEGHFGTGVVSYFTFLRTLLYLNIPVFLLSASFIVIPQILYRFYQQDPSGYVNNTAFTGKELLTGAGWFEQTEMYYGYYINGTINVNSGHSNGSSSGLSGPSYDMAAAYLLTSGGFYLLCLLILARSLARSYRKNFIEVSGGVAFYYMGKVLCGWDFSISEPSTSKLRHKAIFNELTEYLSTSRQKKEKKTCKRICCIVLQRIVTNLFVIALIGGSGYLIWYISITRSLQNNIDVLSEMSMPLCISAFNLILPIAFSIIGAVEQYERPKIELYITMLRTISLKGVNLGVLIYFWYKNVSCQVIEDKSQYTKDRQCIECWETFMGEQVYRLVLVDFVVSLLVTFVAEFIRGVMAKKCCHFLGSPEFDIGRNTLNLIYSQALCWLGHFYCPVLSFIQIIKLVSVFYVKRLSVMMNCVPSSKPWRAARAHTIFLGYLFCAYFMMCASLAISIVLIRPSANCGPFRGLDRPYDVVIKVVDHIKADHSIIDGILMFISSQGFIAACIVALCVGVYYLSMLGKTRREMIALLKHQIQLEGKDKVFLLRMYQEISKDISGGLPPHKPLSAGAKPDPSPNPKRRFAKSALVEAEQMRIQRGMQLEDFRKDVQETHVLSPSSIDHDGRRHSFRNSTKLEHGVRKISQNTNTDLSKSLTSVDSPDQVDASASNASQRNVRSGVYENIWDVRGSIDDLNGNVSFAPKPEYINVEPAVLKNPLYEDEDVGPVPRPISSPGHRISVEALPPVFDEADTGTIPPDPPVYLPPKATESKGRSLLNPPPPLPEESASLGFSDSEPPADYDNSDDADSYVELSYNPETAPTPIEEPCPPASYQPPGASFHGQRQAWDVIYPGGGEENLYVNTNIPEYRAPETPVGDASVGYGPPENYQPPPPPPMTDAPRPPQQPSSLPPAHIVDKPDPLQTTPHPGLSYGPPPYYEPPPPPPRSEVDRQSGDYGVIW